MARAGYAIVDVGFFHPGWVCTEVMVAAIAMFGT
jgi:hypothetical protein